MAKGAKIRQSDIADRAGVARSTVSMILNGRGASFSPDVVERVLRVDRELKYSAGKYRYAKGAENRRGDFLYCVRQPMGPAELPPFYYQMAFRIERAAAAKKRGLIIRNVRDPEELRETLEARGERIDGAVLHGLSPRQTRFLPDALPRVYFLPHFFGENETVVELDNVVGAFALTRHLRDLGHKRLVFWGYAADSKHAEDRLNGFLLGVRKLGLTEVFPYEELNEGNSNTGEADAAKNAALLKRIFQDPNGPTAVVCATSSRAASLVRDALSAGIDIPGRLSVTGFNDYPTRVDAPLPLTCVRVPMDTLAEQTVELLEALTLDPALRGVRLIAPCETVIPGATAAPPRK